MKFRFRRKREEGDGGAQATAERELSEERLEAVRENVIAPLARHASRNQFADIIRASLEGGRK